MLWSRPLAPKMILLWAALSGLHCSWNFREADATLTCDDAHKGLVFLRVWLDDTSLTGNEVIAQVESRSYDASHVNLYFLLDQPSMDWARDPSIYGSSFQITPANGELAFNRTLDPGESVTSLFISGEVEGIGSRAAGFWHSAILETAETVREYWIVAAINGSVSIRLTVGTKRDDAPLLAPLRVEGGCRVSLTPETIKVLGSGHSTMTQCEDEMDCLYNLGVGYRCEEGWCLPEVPDAGLADGGPDLPDASDGQADGPDGLDLPDASSDCCPWDGDGWNGHDGDGASGGDALELDSMTDRPQRPDRRPDAPPSQDRPLDREPDGLDPPDAMPLPDQALPPDAMPLPDQAPPPDAMPLPDQALPPDAMPLPDQALPPDAISDLPDESLPDRYEVFQGH